MSARYAPPARPDAGPLAARLRGGGEFDVDVELAAAGRVVARRVRPLGQRGLLRLLLPRAVVRGRVGPDGPRWRVRPDALAWAVLVVVVGGELVEWTMDRARYPRDYPPAFVHALAGAYVTLLLVELAASRRALRRALGEPSA